MALVKCPECGGSISSVAESCVHCGCKITVCPDCTASHAGEKEVCTACGFNFKKANDVKNGSSYKGILDYWKANCPIDKGISMLIPIILAVMGVGFIAFVIMAVTNVLRLGYNGDNTKIFKIGVSVTVAVIFSVVFFISLIATNVLHSAYIPFRCGAWIRDNEIDVSRFTSQLSALPRSKRTFKNNREIRSAYVAEYPREFSKTVIISAVCGVFYIVCFIIACVFLSEGVDAYIVEKAFTQNPVTLAGKIDWLLLLIPIGIMLVSLAVDIIFRVAFRRNVLKWIGYPPTPKKEKKAVKVETAAPVVVEKPKVEEKSAVEENTAVEEKQAAFETSEEEKTESTEENTVIEEKRTATEESTVEEPTAAEENTVTAESSTVEDNTEADEETKATENAADDKSTTEKKVEDTGELTSETADKIENKEE